MYVISPSQNKRTFVLREIREERSKEICTRQDYLVYSKLNVFISKLVPKSTEDSFFVLNKESQREYHGSFFEDYILNRLFTTPSLFLWFPSVQP